VGTRNIAFVVSSKHPYYSTNPQVTQAARRIAAASQLRLEGM
jgi:hypothetical protein